MGLLWLQMGNSSSSNKSDTTPRTQARIPYQNQLEELFQTLSEDGLFIKKEAFERLPELCYMQKVGSEPIKGILRYETSSIAENKSHFKGPAHELPQALFGMFSQDLECHENGIYHKIPNVNRQNFVKTAHDLLEQAFKVKNAQLMFYFELLVGKNKNVNYAELSKLLRESCTYGLIIGNFDYDDDDDELISEEDAVIKALADSCIGEESSIGKAHFSHWAQEINRNMFSGLQAWIHQRFTGQIPKAHFHMLPMPDTTVTDHSFTILTPSLLWHLCCILPPCYTRLEKAHRFHEHGDSACLSGFEPLPFASPLDCRPAPQLIELLKSSKDWAEEVALNYTWSLLYDSSQHGLSLNRFKHKCLEYKSPTVTLLKFRSGLLLALTLDEPWRDSPERFGGSYCSLLEIMPNCTSILACQKIVYLKEIGRCIPTGLLIGESFPAKVNINKDLSSAEVNYNGSAIDDVSKIEVWGCGGVAAIHAQKKQKDWERKEVEKRRKVKRPGRWDENPDKQILDMAGVRTSHSERGDF